MALFLQESVIIRIVVKLGIGKEVCSDEGCAAYRVLLLTVAEYAW
jgi:hypothetical protein